MNRRKFLQLAAGAGVVATATMAEAGFFAEFMSWVKRQPVWSIPKNAGSAVINQYQDYISVSDLSLETAIDPTIGNLAERFSYRMGFISADDLLPELSTVYYNKKAIESLKTNFVFREIFQGIEASDSAVKRASGKCELPLVSVASSLRKIDHYGEERLAYTRDENGVPRRVVYNATTNKLDFLPTSSLVFKT